MPHNILPVAVNSLNLPLPGDAGFGGLGVSEVSSRIIALTVGDYDEAQHHAHSYLCTFKREVSGAASHRKVSIQHVLPDKTVWVNTFSAIGCSPTEPKAYIFDDKLQVLNTDTGQIKGVETPEFVGYVMQDLCFSPDGKKVYAVTEMMVDGAAQPFLSVFSTDIDTLVRNVPLPSGGWIEPVFAPDGETAYLADNGVHATGVLYIDAATDEPQQVIDVAGLIHSMCISYDGKKLYINVDNSLFGGPRILIMDTATKEIANTIEVPDHVEKISLMASNFAHPFIVISAQYGFGRNTTDLFVLDSTLDQFIGRFVNSGGLEQAGLAIDQHKIVYALSSRSHSSLVIADFDDRFKYMFATALTPNFFSASNSTVVSKDRVFVNDGDTSDAVMMVVGKNWNTSPDDRAKYQVYSSSFQVDSFKPDANFPYWFSNAPTGPLKLHPDYSNGAAVYLQTPDTTADEQSAIAMFVRFDGHVDAAPKIRLNKNPQKGEAIGDAFVCETDDGRYVLCNEGGAIKWIPYNALPDSVSALRSILCLVVPFNGGAI